MLVLIGVMIFAFLFIWLIEKVRYDDLWYRETEEIKDLHCDMCSDGMVPMIPVIRCRSCKDKMKKLLNDPMFGFDFNKHYK